MKLNNFRIRQKVNQRVITSQDFHSAQTPQKSRVQDVINTPDEIRLSSLLQSFQNIISNLVNSNPANPKAFPQSSSFTSALPKKLEYRDRFVLIDLPDFTPDNIDLQRLQPWIGLVCEQSLSVAFCYFLQKKMNYDQMKAFASESLLRNIVNLADRYHLNHQVFRFIDETMNNKILPFLKAKYPLAVEKLVNKALQSVVKSVDNSEIVSNEYFFTSDICFEHRESGRYDDVIMRLLNELMQRTDKPSASGVQGRISNYKQFETMMTQIFEKSFDQEWMEGKSGAEPTKDEKQMQKYEQKVKQYTDFLIGRKISENTPLFTEEEIKSGYLSIKSPAILRILTKWCDQLWAKFENENYYTERTDGLLLIKSKKIGLVYPWLKDLLKTTMRQQKEGILKFMKEMQELNYKQQAHLLQNQIQNPDNLYIQKHQRVTGKFACKIVNNIESFVVDYLNRLIHGLTSVSKKCFIQMQQFKEYWPTPYNLMTFNVSDLLRCRYSSKEKEVLMIFKEILKLANNHPQKFKIIKIKNRLKDVTNDIMIIAKLNNTINCEVQIAVNNSISEFMNCSNRINHYIYELERSTFGPILELCSIWKNCEKRSEIFNRIIEQEKPKKQVNRIEKGECSKNAKDHDLTQEKQPFVCSECSKHFYHNNFIVSHKKCKKCEYWKCARCLISQNFENNNKAFFFSEEKAKLGIKFCKDHNSIPNYGVCIFINRPTIEPIAYMKLKHNYKDYLVHMKKGQLTILKKFKSNKEIQKFYKECLVFDLPAANIKAQLGINNQRDALANAIRSLFLPSELSESLKQQKQAISILRQDHLTKVDFDKLYTDHFDKLKFVESIEFSSCAMSRINNVLAPGFVNLKRLNLNLNQLTSFDEICQFKKLQKLYISENRSPLPENIGDLHELKELYSNGNSIMSLPESFSKLTKLTILNFSNNRLEQIPDYFGQFHKLKELDAKNNKIKKIPVGLMKLKNLEVLIMETNQIEQMPQDIDDLQGLKILNFRKNNIPKISNQIGQLSNLIQCDFSLNLLTELPQSLFILSKLQILRLSDNKLKAIPQKIGNLKALTQLNLYNNAIQQWNNSIFNLTQLTDLNLSTNKLTTVGDEFDKLKSLKHLNISENKLTTLPPSIQKLKTLSSIKFWGNLFQTLDIKLLPDFNTKKIIRINNLNQQNSLKELTCEQMPSFKDEISTIQVSSTQMQKIPEFIFDFHNVKTLKFMNSKIIQIPDKFEFQTQLTSLWLNDNLLKQIPPSLSRAQSLEQISLSNNKLEQFPESICELRKLKSLNLSSNKIKTFPQKLKELSMLSRLSITNNEVEMIPDCIGELIGLKYLEMGQNKIKEIPESLLEHKELFKLVLDSNLIEVLPEKISLMKALKEFIIKNNPIKTVQNEESFKKKFPRALKKDSQSSDQQNY